MALAVAHTFTSSVPDDAASTAAGEVTPTRWNGTSAHTLSGTADTTQVDQTAAFAFSALGLTHISDATQSTSSTTGSLTTAGGLGVVKDAFFGNKLTTFNDIATSGGSYIVSTNGAFQWSGKGGITQPSTAVLQLGFANAASPVAQTVQAQGSRSGTDSDVGGANLTITAGNGTGIGTLSSLILQSPKAVGSGTGAQTQTTGLTIKGGQAVASSYTVATLPTGIFGGMATVTDGDAGLAWGATVVNTGAGATKYLVWFNNTNWTVMGK